MSKIKEYQFDDAMKSLCAALDYAVTYDPIEKVFEKNPNKKAPAVGPDQILGAIENAKKHVEALHDDHQVHRLDGIEEVLSLVLDHLGLDVVEHEPYTELVSNKPKAARKPAAKKEAPKEQ